jgi:hypothetical protein
MKKLLSRVFFILSDIIFTIAFFSQGEMFMGILSIFCAVFGIADICFNPSSKCEDCDEEDEY